MNIVILTPNIVALANGNPGAATVICQLLKKEREEIFALAGLEQFEITGYKIWLCYKDYCKNNLDDLIKNILDVNMDMIDFARNS